MEFKDCQDPQRTSISPGRVSSTLAVLSISHTLKGVPPFSLCSQALPIPCGPDHPTSMGVHISLVPGTSSGCAQSSPSSNFVEREPNWPCWEHMSIHGQSNETKAPKCLGLNAPEASADKGYQGWGCKYPRSCALGWDDSEVDVSQKDSLADHIVVGLMLYTLPRSFPSLYLFPVFLASLK